jgi:hypothetical protein
MKTAEIEAPVTLWMKDDVPDRLVYAGRRWRVSDTPTRLRDSIWTAPAGGPRQPLYGWRFQATSEDGEAIVFDVYKAQDGWHVHHTWS